MTIAPEKTPKKEKAKRQSPEERKEALRWNHMMYGPTAGEIRPVIKKIDFGASYLSHPKFQSLMTAFKSGSEFQFNVTHKEKTHIISTDGSHIFFDNKIIYYSRRLNKFENHLLVDRSTMRQHQTVEPFIHLAFAVIRSLPELGTQPFSYRNNEFSFSDEGLGMASHEQSPNLMVGVYKIIIGKTK